MRDPAWDAMFDLQYDLCRELDVVIDAAIKGKPPIVRSTAMLYVLERFAERTRFEMELPAVTDLTSSQDGRAADPERAPADPRPAAGEVPGSVASPSTTDS